MVEQHGKFVGEVLRTYVIKGLFVGCSSACVCIWRLGLLTLSIVPRGGYRGQYFSLFGSRIKKIDKGQTHLSQLCPLTRLLVGSRPITAHQINLFGVLQFVRFGFSGGTILFNCCSNRTGSSIFLG